jgi:diguanylate cyclase
VNSAPELSEWTNLHEASVAVVEYLKATIPLGLWSVTRHEGYRQRCLAVVDDVYGLAPGDELCWPSALSLAIATGEAPQIVPDAASVPDWQAAAAAMGVDIGTCIGIPIRRSNGEAFGILCGMDPAKRPADLVQQRPMLDLLAGLLSKLMESECVRTDTIRRLELAELINDSDPVTGLYNRRGWMKCLERADSRYRRHGGAALAIVIDLDRIEHINADHGRDAGDEYLKSAGTILSTTLRATDVTARLHGDVFAVLAADVVPEKVAITVDRIRSALGIGRSDGLRIHAHLAMDGGLIAAFDKAEAEVIDVRQVRYNRGGPTD